MPNGRVAPRYGAIKFSSAKRCSAQGLPHNIRRRCSGYSDAAKDVLGMDIFCVLPE